MRAFIRPSGAERARRWNNTSALQGEMIYVETQRHKVDLNINVSLYLDKTLKSDIFITH